MICPFCRHKEDKVVDSRLSGDSIRRRRECLQCGRRFTTYEYVEVASLLVVKRDGSREPFHREKLLHGIMTACKKRPVSKAQMETMTTEIETALIQMEADEVSYSEIGTLVMENLKRVDQVAYVRFASVYREFKEIGEFVNAIQQIGG